jgi:glutamyl-tRNA synthetase
MLAFLGWNPGTNQEIFSMDELIEAFDLTRVSKAGAKFDLDKTKWYQAQYLRAKDNNELATLLKPYLKDSFDEAYLATACGLIKERATFIEDIAEEGAYLFTEDFTYNEKIAKKKWNDEAKFWLNDLTANFNQTDFSATALETAFKAYMEDKGLKFGQIGPVLRLAVTGAASGPSLFEICALLGKEKTNTRISKAIETLG